MITINPTYRPLHHRIADAIACRYWRFRLGNAERDLRDHPRASEAQKKVWRDFAADMRVRIADLS